MHLLNTLKQVAAKLPLGRRLVEFRRLRARQDTWSTVHRATFGKTSLALLTNIGLGDIAVAGQICNAFTALCQNAGDPKLGKIVITAGAWPTDFVIEAGDHQVYWWWSMAGRADWLDFFLDKINIKPSVVACLSEYCLNYARRLGCNTVYLPLAAGPDFTDLNLPRKGIGYAGSKGHKDLRQESIIIDPFSGNSEFDWVHDLPTLRDVSKFYNRKQVVLGMTETFQEQAGMVNARFFEVLATGTPFIIHKHRALSQVLGSEYPFQSGSATQTKELCQELLGDYKRHLARFAEYQQLVATQHTYRHRLESLFAFLQAGPSGERAMHQSNITTSFMGDVK
jgi:hypothetical protein